MYPNWSSSRRRRSRANRQQNPPSSLSPMADAFFPGTPSYGAPYHPSPLSQMFTASSFDPSPFMVLPQPQNFHLVVPTLNLLQLPMYGDQAHVLPQTQMYGPLGPYGPPQPYGPHEGYSPREYDPQAYGLREPSPQTYDLPSSPEPQPLLSPSRPERDTSPTPPPDSPRPQSDASPSPDRLHQLSPEFPFYDTVRPYYRDEWTAQDHEADRLENAQFEEARAQAETENKSEPAADEPTPTQPQANTEDHGHQEEERGQPDVVSEAEPKAATEQESTAITPSSPEKDSQDPSSVFLAIMQRFFAPFHPDPQSGAAEHDTLPSTSQAYEREAVKNGSSSNIQDRAETKAQPTQTPVASTGPSVTHAAVAASTQQFIYPHPFLPNSIVSELPSEIASLASLNAEIDRWTADSLLPPSRPRSPRTKRTPDYPLGAIGDGRKKRKGGDDKNGRAARAKRVDRDGYRENNYGGRHRGRG